MPFLHGLNRKSLLLVGGAVLGCLLLAGCDDQVTVIRDPDIPVRRQMTWAWRPMGSRPAASREDRRVVSRDVIVPEQKPWHNMVLNNEVNRNKLKEAIERVLRSKGLVQVSDPQAADFLVDYQVAVRSQDVTVQRVYPGDYPGLVCGWYGCWYGWGPPEVGYENIRMREGTFVFDLTTRGSKKLAYRAIGQKPIDKNSFTSYQVEEAIKHLLKGLKVN